MLQQTDALNPASYNRYQSLCSFAQYATINREVFQDPAIVFNEQKPVEVPEGEPQQFQTVVIKRDPSLTNDLLAPTHKQLVGAAIMDRLEEIFGDTDARIPRYEPNSRPSSGKCEYHQP